MSETEPFSALISCDDRWTVLLCGELDARSRGALESLATAISATGCEAVDFDLSGVTFTDIAGWRSVCTAARSLNASGTTARIVNPSREVRRLTEALRCPDRRRPAPKGAPAKAA